MGDAVRGPHGHPGTQPCPSFSDGLSPRNSGGNLQGSHHPQKLGLGAAWVWGWLLASHVCPLPASPASFLIPLSNGGAAGCGGWSPDPGCGAGRFVKRTLEACEEATLLMAPTDLPPPPRVGLFGSVAREGGCPLEMPGGGNGSAASASPSPRFGVCQRLSEFSLNTALSLPSSRPSVQE